MKKILSLTLVICMLLSACTLFSSCSKIDEKKFKEDPQEALYNAFDKVNSEFFQNDAQAAQIIEDTLKKGAITLTVESDTIKDETGLGKIVVTEYIDSEGKKAVTDLLVNVNDQDLGAKLFIDKNGVIVSGNDILGTDTAYAINPATISEKLLTSDLAKILGIDGGKAGTEATEIIGQIGNIYKKAFETTEEQGKANVNDLLALLNPTTTEEKVEINGKNVKCVVVAYTINNQTYRALMNKYLEQAGMNNETITAAFKESMDEMDEEATYALTLKILLNKKTGALAKATLEGTATTKEYDGFNEETWEPIYKDVTVTLNGELALSDTEIALTINANDGTETTSAAIKLTKTEDGDNTVYKLAISTKEGNEAAVEPLSLTFTTNDKTGDFSVEAKIRTEDYDEEGNETTEEQVFAVTGNVAVDGKTATIAIKSIKYGETALELKNLSLKFDSAAELPAAPATPTDVVNMTTADIQAFMQSFQNSKLGKLIFGFSIN